MRTNLGLIILWSSIFHFLSIAAKSQLSIEGGSVKIFNGASIICSGDVTNNSGTITNDGRLETHGSFLNNGTYNSTANEDSLLLTKTGDVTLAGATSILHYLAID